MSQRDSGYVRKELDKYQTPAWVTEALLQHIPTRVVKIWEPACGDGKMSRVFKLADYEVEATDIECGVDFLTCTPPRNVDAIITNPPYTYAKEFIETALINTKRGSGFVAMLLRTDYDHAKTRAQFFAHCPVFSMKLVLTKRIKWFEHSTGSPSFNHCWMLWDWTHEGPPTIAYHIEK